MTLSNGIFFTTDKNGDRLTLEVPSYVVTQNGDWKLGLTKTTPEALEQDIAEANAVSPLLYVSDTVDTAEYSFTITSAQFVDEFYPPDTSGYYTYCYASSGNSLCLVRGTFKYLGTSFADLKYGTEAVFSLNNGEYEITGEVLGARSDSDDFYDYQVGPFESVELYIYCEMSNELISNITSAEVIWKFADPLNTFYNSSSDGPVTPLRCSRLFKE